MWLVTSALSAFPTTPTSFGFVACTIESTLRPSQVVAYAQALSRRRLSNLMLNQRHRRRRRHRRLGHILAKCPPRDSRAASAMQFSCVQIACLRTRAYTLAKSLSAAMCARAHSVARTVSRPTATYTSTQVHMCAMYAASHLLRGTI